MKITVESTSEIVHVGDVETRAWTGKTSKGTPVVALIARLGVMEGHDVAALEAEFAELRHATTTVLDGLGVPSEQRPSRLGWLEPDFVALYTAAAATIDISTLSQTRAVRGALLAQLDRLRPAFETLKRELEQRKARLDALANAAEATPGERLIHRLAQTIAVDTATPEAGHDCGATAEGPMPHAITAAIIDDPVHVDAADTVTAGTWIAFAMRGAAMGWHAAHAHPNDVAGICRTVATSLDEPHRAAWEHGYRLAVDFAGQLKAAAPIVAVAAGVVQAATAAPLAPLVARSINVEVEYVEQRCRVCGCTDDDCSQCIAKTGEPCSWVEADLCSACDGHPESQL